MERSSSERTLEVAILISGKFPSGQEFREYVWFLHTLGLKLKRLILLFRATAPFNPSLVSSVGGVSNVRGIRCLSSPSKQYEEFGLPLESPTGADRSSSASSPEGTISPLMYVKGIRDLSYGMSLLVLQIQHREVAITTLIAVGALVSLADGDVVWKHAGSNTDRKRMAYYNWVTFVLFAVWYFRRRG